MPIIEVLGPRQDPPMKCFISLLLQRSMWSEQQRVDRRSTGSLVSQKVTNPSVYWTSINGLNVTSLGTLCWHVFCMTWFR